MYKLYTKNNCGNCNVVKGIVQGMNIDTSEIYEEINVDEDETARQYLITNGIMSLPALEVATNEFKTALFDISQAIQAAAQAEQ